MDTITVEYDGTPPSLNRLAHAHWTKFRTVKREWQSIFEVLVMELKVRRGYWAKATATGSLRFPTKRTRDEGNYRSIIEKALGDALVNGNWIPGDSTDEFRFQGLGVESEKGPCRTTLVIRFEGER